MTKTKIVDAIEHQLAALDDIYENAGHMRDSLPPGELQEITNQIRQGARILTDLFQLLERKLPPEMINTHLIGRYHINTELF